MKLPDKPLRNRADACKYLDTRYGIKRAPSTLAKEASLRTGPRFLKAGRTPLYTEDSLDAYAASLLREPHSGGKAA